MFKDGGAQNVNIFFSVQKMKRHINSCQITIFYT